MTGRALVRAGVGALVVACVVAASLWIVGLGASAATDCPSTTPTSIGGVPYSYCDLRVPHFAGFGENLSRVPHATGELDGVSYDAVGYYTMDCPVVRISGNDSAGAPYVLYLASVPSNCRDSPAPVFVLDGAFGATWSGSSSIVTLYVRSPS
ncbi:MAG TPA: hypothetical protein VML94_02485 [Thermoplasmata archaeon]|nr:hypothetical protein [Thermoplasmata archaeon]